MIRKTILGAIAFAGLFAFGHSAFAAAPTGFTSQAFRDNNGDGTIDRIVVVINGGEALTSCDVSAGELSTDWTYNGGADYGGSIASASCDTATATITFTLTGVTGFRTGNPFTAPTIAYDNDDGDNSIANASGNLGTVSAATTADEAAPIFLSSFSLYQDGNSNGTIEKVSFSFSEYMNCTFEAGDWAVTTAGTVNLSSPAGGCSVSGGTIWINISANSNITGGATAPVMSYTNQGTLGSLSDTAGNQLPTNASLTINDGAPPIIISGAYSDNNNDGEVDSIIYATTPDTGMNCGSYAAGDTTVNTAGTVTINTTGASTCSSNGTSTYTITLATVGATDTTGGSTDPVVTYTSTSGHLRDGAFYNVPTKSSLTLADQAKPVVTTKTPAASSTHVSRGDSFVVTFSEAMATGAFGFATSPVQTNTPTWSNGNKTVTLAHAIMLPAHTYTATVQGVSQDAVGNTVGSDYQWTFRTKAINGNGWEDIDPTAPVLSSDSDSGTVSVTTSSSGSSGSTSQETTTPSSGLVSGVSTSSSVTGGAFVGVPPVSETEEVVVPVITQNTPKMDLLDFNGSLRRGSRGQSVAKVQAFLVLAGKLTMPADAAYGYYGDLTKAATVAFQLEKGLVSGKDDSSAGYFGPKTRGAANVVLTAMFGGAQQ